MDKTWLPMLSFSAGGRPYFLPMLLSVLLAIDGAPKSEKPAKSMQVRRDMELLKMEVPTYKKIILFSKLAGVAFVAIGLEFLLFREEICLSFIFIFIGTMVTLLPVRVDMPVAVPQSEMDQPDNEVPEESQQEDVPDAEGLNGDGSAGLEEQDSIEEIVPERLDP